MRIEAGTMERAAMQYRRYKVCAIPIPAGTKKAANVWRQYQTRLPTLRQEQLWFHNCVDWNIAVVGGEVSGGLVVRDWDVPEAFVEWTERYPSLARSLPIVRTPDGNHGWFRTDDCGFSVEPDGEYRGRGHYSVAPPSWVEEGGRCRQYTWQNRLRNGVIPFIKDPQAAGLISYRPRTLAAQRACGEKRARVESAAEYAAILPESGLPEDVQRAILATLPDRAGVRSDRLFDFARLVKFRPDGELPVDERQYVVAVWTRLAVKARTKSERVNQARFATAYEDARFAPGTSERMRAAIEAAAACGNALAAVRVRAFCAALADENGCFYLSRLKAAEVLGISASVCQRQLDTLVHDGVLMVVTPGVRGRGGDNTATRYQWTGTPSCQPAPSQPPHHLVSP